MSLSVSRATTIDQKGLTCKGRGGWRGEEGQQDKHSEEEEEEEGHTHKKEKNNNCESHRETKQKKKVQKSVR